MPIMYEMDLGGDNFETCDLGRAVPEGWYHAVVEKVAEGQAGKSLHLVFQFRILAGDPDGQRGKLVEDKLYLTKKTRQRQLMFAKRLGLLKKDDFGKTVAFDWEEATTRHVIIHVKEEEYETTDADGRPKKGKASRLEFEGLYNLDHPEVRDVPRDGQARKPGAGTATSGKTQAPHSGAGGAAKPGGTQPASNGKPATSPPMNAAFANL